MTDKENKAQNKVQGAAALGGGMIASETAANEAAATDRLQEELNSFLDTYNAKKNIDPEKLKGFLFERIEAGKFNIDAIRKGSNERAYLTSDTKGRGTDSVDIEIKNKNKVIQKIQAKTSNYPSNLAREIQKDKYKGMEKLIPKNQIKEIEDKISKKDTNIIGEIKRKNISSGGTDTHELKIATKHPQTYAHVREAEQITHEAHATGWQAAKSATIIGVSLSFVKNAHAYIHGDVDENKAIKNIGKDALKISTRSYYTSALGAIIRNFVSKSGLKTLTKSNIATSIAANVIDAGSTVLSLIKREISSEEAAERLGATGCTILSSIYTRAAAGAIFGAPAGIIGSMAGYMLTASVYQSCIVIIKEAQLAEKESERVEDICREAVKAMRKQREQFELALSEHLDEQRFAFDKCFETIDAALVEDRLIEAIQGISNLVIIFGKELQLSNFKDFDDFMTDSDEPLVL